MCGVPLPLMITFFVTHYIYIYIFFDVIQKMYYQD